MSKVVQAVNAMVQQSEHITKVLPGLGNPNEFYFQYKKYKWSIICDFDKDEFSLWYYPSETSLEQLASQVPLEQEQEPMLKFSSKDIGTKEAVASFKDLYQIVKSKLFRVDEVLDDIIKDTKDEGDIPF